MLHGKVVVNSDLPQDLTMKHAACSLCQRFQTRESPGSVAGSTRGALQTAVPVATATASRSAGEPHAGH